MCRDITDSPGEGVRGSAASPGEGNFRRAQPVESVLSYTSGRRRR